LKQRDVADGGRSWGRDEGLYSTAGGQAIRLDSGNTLFNAGTAGVLQEVTPTGDLVWEARASVGDAFIKLLPVRDFYTLWAP